MAGLTAITCWKNRINRANRDEKLDFWRAGEFPGVSAARPGPGCGACSNAQRTAAAAAGLF